MIESKIRTLTGQASRSSIFLSRSLLESNRIERNLEKKSLILKRKIVEERGRTLRNLASTNRETQKGGVLGGALGLLGLGGGGGLLRRGLRRTPSSPNQLLRMQRGTSNLSRVGRAGRLARPLAIVGTGLDFVGRRAEGQTNLQAGVGAGGGLAGAIGGAKIGASIGTAILPGAGTAIGGIGGSIIGGLVGGNLADLFTGANRRREFEEQRTLIRSQKTLFSEALDDFDDVLDKFEDIAIGLAAQRRGDNDEQGRRKRPFLPIIPSIGARILKFLSRPDIQATGFTLAAAGLLTAAVATRGTSLPATQKILEKALVKSPFLRKLSEKEQIAAIGKIIERSLSKSAQQRVRMNASPFLDKLGRFTPGKKGAPGKTTKKTNIIKKRLEEKKSQKNLEKEIRKDIVKEGRKAQKFFEESGFTDPNVIRSNLNDRTASDLIDLKILLDKGKISKTTFNMAKNAIEKAKIETLKMIDQYDDAIIEFLSKPKNFTKAGDFVLKNFEKMRRKLELFNPENITKPEKSTGIIKKLEEAAGTLKGKDFEAMDDVIEFLEKGIPFKKIKRMPFDPDPGKLKVSDDLEPNSTNLAQASMGEIFLLGGESNKNQQPPTIINDGSSLAMKQSNTSPYRAVAQILMVDSLFTA